MTKNTFKQILEVIEFMGSFVLLLLIFTEFAPGTQNEMYNSYKTIFTELKYDNKVEASAILFPKYTLKDVNSPNFTYFYLTEHLLPIMYSEDMRNFILDNNEIQSNISSIRN